VYCRGLAPRVPLAELWARQYSAIIGEADEPAIERGVPEYRQEKPVVHVEALLVAAVRPGEHLRHRPIRGGARQSVGVRVASARL